MQAAALGDLPCVPRGTRRQSPRQEQAGGEGGGRSAADDQAGLLFEDGGDRLTAREPDDVAVPADGLRRERPGRLARRDPPLGQELRDPGGVLVAVDAGYRQGELLVRGDLGCDVVHPLDVGVAARRPAGADRDGDAEAVRGDEDGRQVTEDRRSRGPGGCRAEVARSGRPDRRLPR